MLLLVMMAASTVIAEDAGAAGPDEKSLRYYKVLLRRSESGYVFDRFCNSFLDTQTMQQLEDFLKENAEKSGNGARLLLGYYYTKNSDYDSAVKEFTKLIDSAEESGKIRVSAYHHRGSANLSQLDFEAAIADYKAALALKPLDKDKLAIARQLSKAYIRSGKQKEAIALWEKIVSENPEKQDLQEDLIELYIEEELYIEGLKVTDALLEKTKDSYDRVMRTLRKGDIYQFSGKDPNAIELYSETLSMVGQGTWLEREILAQISRVFMREENKKGLEKHFADLITQYPSRISLVMKYSQILAGNGKYDQAIETYKEVLKLAPGDKDAAWQFVRLLTDAKKQDEAIKAMESLVSQYKGDLELRLSLAELYNTAKKTDLAVKAVKSYLADSDKSEYAYTRVGRLFEKYKSKEDADQLYNEMAKAYPDSTGAKEVLAAYYNRTERKDEAVEIWKALAENGELEVVLRACRTLKSNKFGETAFTVINARFDEFKNDIVFLSNAVDIASGLKKHAQAVRWAMDMTIKAESSGQLENAITKTKAVVKYAKKLDDVINSLEKNEALNVQQSCLLAELYNEIGEYEKAIKILDSSDGQNEGLVLSQRIRICSQNYQWHEAAETAEKLFASKGGSNSRNAKKLVTLYRKSLQTDKAIKWVNRWKELSPGSTTPWMVHADILYANGKSTESINTLRIAVRKFDANEELLTKLAQNYRNTARYADAKRIYWKMYENSESISDKLTWVEQLASIARETGTLNTLTEQFKQRKQQDRISVLPRLALARIYNRSEDYELRRRELIEVSRLKPDDISVIYEIAKLEEMAGRWQDAITTLKKAKEFDTTTKTDYKIARLHMEYGNEEQGIKMLLDLAGGYDADPRQAESLADMLIMGGYPKMAVKYLDEIIAKYPADWRIKYLRAIALEEQDKVTEAVEIYLSLLGEDTEIKLGKSKQNNPYAAQAHYFVELKRIVPPRAVDFWMNMNYSHMAYSYMQQRNHYRGPSMSARQPLIQIPQTLEMLKSFSVVHILSIKSYLDEDEGKQIGEKLSEAGISNAELFAELTLDGNNYFNQNTAMIQLLEKYPDHEIPLALSAWMGHQMIDPNLCLRQINKFKKSYPFLAAIAGIKYYSIADEKDEKILAESFKMLGSIEKPTLMGVQLLIQSAQRFMNDNSDENKSAQKKLCSLLIDWSEKYVDTQNQSYMPQYIFSTISQLAIKGGDYEMFAELINKELARFKKKAAKAGPQNINIYSGGYGSVTVFGSGRHGNNLFIPLTFPPMQLPGYPNYLLQLLAGMNNDHYIRQMNLDLDELVKIADKIEDPLLRVYLYHSTGKTEEEEKLFTKLAKDSPKDGAVTMYKAARAFSKEQFHIAVTAIDTIRKSTGNRKIKQGYDKVLASAAVSFFSLGAEEQAKKCTDEEQAKIKELGQKALLRLRKSTLASNQKAQLSEAMRTLGLAKEANKMDKLIAAAAATSHAPAPSYSGGIMPSRNMSYDQAKIEKLIASGKTDEAFKKLKKFFEGHAKNDLMNMGNNSYYQVRNPKQYLQQRSLLKEMVAVCKPKNNTSSRVWQVYAKVCEYLDQTEELKKAWAKVLELKPKDPQANLYAAMYALDDDPNTAADHIKKIRKNRIPMMLQSLDAMFNYSHENYKMRFTACKLAIALLKHPGIDGRTDLSYSSRVLQHMEGSLYIRTQNKSFNINGIFTKAQKLDPDSQKIWDEREKLFKELLDILYEIPSVCDRAYICKIRLARSRGTYDNNKAIAMAEETLKRYKFAQQRHSYSNSMNSTAPISACEILLEKALKDGNVDEKCAEIVEILKKNRNTNHARQFKALVKLYTVSAEEFGEAAAKYGQQFPYSYQSVIVSDKQGYKHTFIIAGKRKDIDQTSFICKLLQNKSKRYNMNIQYNDLTVLAQQVLKDKGADKAEEFVEKVSTALTTTADKRKAYCDKNYNPNQSHQQGTKNYMVYTYYNFLNYLTNNNDPDLTRIVFGHIKYIPRLHMDRVRNISSRIYSVIRSSDTNKSKELIVKIGLVGTPEEMIFTPYVRNSEPYLTINSYIVNRLRGSSSYKKRFVEALGKCPDSFGKKLVLAVVERNNSKAHSALKENFEAIKKLSAKKQSDLISFIRETTGAIKGLGDIDKDPDEVDKWYASIVNKAISEELESFMKMTPAKLFTNNMHESRFHDMVAKIAITVIHDPNSFDKLMARADEMYKKGIRRRSFSKIQGHYRNTFIERYIDRSSNQKSPAVCKFYVDIIRKKGCTLREINDYRIRRLFEGHIRQNRDSYKPGDNKKAFTSLVNFVGQVYGNKNATIGFGTTLRSYVFDYYRTTDDFTKVVTMLEGLKKESKYPVIVDELIINAKNRWSERERDKDKQKKLYDDVYKYYLAILSDEELSAPWRFAVHYNMKGYIRSKEGKLAFTLKAMDVLIKYMQAGNCQYYQVYRISENIMNSYISVAHTEEWKTKANQYIELYFQVWSKMQKSSSRSSSNDNLIFKLLRLHFEANGGEKPDVVDRLVRVSGGNLWKTPEIYAIMVNYGQHDRARKALVNNKHTWNLSSSSNTIRMTKEFEAKSDAFIDSFDNPEDALFAKITMWLRSDSGSNLKIKMKDRVIQLAKDYLELVESKSSQGNISINSDLVMQRLLAYDYVYPVLRKRIFKLCKDKDILASMANDNSKLKSYNQALATAYFNICSAEGNVEPLIKTIEKMGVYCTPNGRYRYEVTSWVRTWTRSIYDKIRSKGVKSTKQLTACSKLFEATFNESLKLGRNYRGNLSLGNLGRSYGTIALASGEFDKFEKTISKLNKQDMNDVKGYVNLSSLLSEYRQLSRYATLDPVLLSKSLANMHKSEYFKNDFKNQGIGVTTSIYSHMKQRYSIDIKYLIKCVEKENKYIKPIDAGYLYFAAKDPAKAIAACSKGIKEAKTDLEKTSLLIDMATYSVKSDPNSYEQCWNDIQPYKDRLDQRLKEKYNNTFRGKISEAVKKLNDIANNIKTGKNLIDMLNDDKLTLTERLTVYSSMAHRTNQLKDRDNDAILNAIMDTHLKFMQDGDLDFALPYSISNHFVMDFANLQHTDKWKEKANQFMDLFFQHWEKRQKSRHRIATNGPIVFKYLRLHFAANGQGKPEVIDHAQKMSGGGLWRIPDTYAMMVQYGQQDRACEALMKHKHLIFTGSNNFFKMSPEFEAKAAAFIDSFEKPEAALVAKLAMWVINDETKDNQHEKLKLKRNERLIQLAKDYLELTTGEDGKIKTNATYDSVFLHLLAQQHVRPIIKERIFKLFKGQDFFALMTKADNNSKRNYYLALSNVYFRICIEEGNAKPLTDTIAKMMDYCTQDNNRNYSKVTGWVRNWIQPFYDSFIRDKELKEKYLTSVYQIYHATFISAEKIERNYRGNLSLSDIATYYRVLAMAEGKMDEFLKSVSKLNDRDKRDIDYYIRLSKMLRDFRSGSIINKITPAKFSKGISDICASEVYKAELKKAGVGEILSVYYYLQQNHRYDIKYLVKCLDGENKYLKPIDAGYLYFNAKDTKKAIAACDKGIKEATTDLEKTALIIDKATYSMNSDPDSFEQAWKEIQPYKDNLDSRLKQRFDTAFSKIAEDHKKRLLLISKKITTEKAFVEAVTDEKLSLSERLTIYQKVRSGGYDFRIHNKEATGHVVMDMQLKYMQQDNLDLKLVYKASINFIEDYITLEHTDKWKEKANQYLELFYQRWVEMQKSSDSFSTSKYLIFRYLMLHFEANGVEKPEVLDYALKISDDTLWKIPETYAIMVNCGLYDMARKTLLDNRQKLHSHSYQILKMTPELEAKSAAFIESFESPADALFAKLVMWTQRDDTKDALYEKLNLKQDERIVRLATDYLEVTTNPDGSIQSDDNLKRLFMHLLASYGSTYPILKERVIKLAEGQDFLAQISKNRDSRLRAYYQYLAQAYFTYCVEEGNAKPMVDTMAKMEGYLKPGDGAYTSVVSYVHNWMHQLVGNFYNTDEIPEKQLTALYQICHAAFNNTTKHEMNRHFGSLTGYYADMSMVEGKMDVFLKSISELSSQDMREVANSIKLNTLLENFCKHGVLNKIPPARFSKGISEICGSELYKAELQKNAIGEIESIYLHLNEEYKYGINYLVKCLEGDKKYLKPVDAAFLYYHAKDMEKCIAACDKGIKEAKTDLEKAALIIDKATYSMNSDPDSFEQAWKEIQPYKAKLSKKQTERFNTLFKEKITQTEKQPVEPKKTAARLSKEMTVAKHLLGFLKDNKISELKRLAQYRNLPKEIKYLNAEDTLHGVMDLNLQYLEQDNTEFSEEYKKTLCFVEGYIKLEHTEKWKEKARRYQRLINEKYLKSNSRSSFIHGVFALNLLRLHFEVNGSENLNGAEDILVMSKGSLWRTPETYAIMVKYGQQDRAHKELVAQKSPWVFHWGYTFSMTPEFETKAEAFIKSFEKPDDKFNAALAMWLRDDGNGKLKLSRQARIASILEEAKKPASKPEILKNIQKAASLYWGHVNDPDKDMMMCEIAIAAAQKPLDRARLLIQKANLAKKMNKKDVVEAAWREIQAIKDKIVDKKLIEEYNKVFAEQIKKQASEQENNSEASREDKIKAVNARLRELAEQMNEKAKEGAEVEARMKSISEDVHRTLNDINRKVDEDKAKKEEEAKRKAEELKKQKQVKGFVFKTIIAA